MGDKFKVPSAHIKAHSKYLAQQKKIQTSDLENDTLKAPNAHVKAHTKQLEQQKKLQEAINLIKNKHNAFKVPQEHIEAHLDLLVEQHQSRTIELDHIREIKQQQKELEAQIKSLQQTDNDTTSREITYPQLD